MLNTDQVLGALTSFGLTHHVAAEGPRHLARSNDGRIIRELRKDLRVDVDTLNAFLAELIRQRARILFGHRQRLVAERQRDALCAVWLAVLQLLDIPVRLSKRKVHDAHVAAHTGHVLQVPHRERIVIAVREDDSIGFGRLQDAIGVVKGHVVARAAVDSPSLGRHVDRHNSRKHAQRSGQSRDVAAQPLYDCKGADAYPHGKDHEGAHVEVVTLAWLRVLLILLNCRKDAGHQEQDQIDRGHAPVTLEVEEHTHQAQHERQHEEVHGELVTVSRLVIPAIDFLLRHMDRRV